MATFLVLIITLGAIVYKADGQDNFVVNLLSDKAWIVEGGKSTATQLNITGIGRTININGNPSTVQHNPPIDILGGALGFDNVFDIKFQLALDVKEGASVRLYGTLPKIYNGALAEGDYVEIGIGGGNLTGKVCVEGACFVEASAPLRGAAPYNIMFDLQRGSFTISGIESYFPASTIFDNGRLYFGFDVALTKTLEITGVLAEGAVHLLKGYKTAVVPRGQSTIGAVGLRLPREVVMGVGVATIPLFTDSLYSATLGKNFAEMTPQTAMQFEFIHPQEGIFAYQDADAVADFAKVNGMKLHCGSLAWSKNVPPWVNTTVQRSNVEIVDILQNHITTVVSHFKGKCGSWDVITEPIDGEESVWHKALGDSHARSVFLWAKQADPSAHLYVAQSALYSDSAKAKALLDILTAWRSQGVAMDGVNIQFDGSPTTPFNGQAAKIFGKIADLSLRVRVSNVRISSSDSESSWLYTDILQACVEAPNCEAFSFWGVTDAYSNVGPTLPFDTNYNPKPSTSAILKYLSSLVSNTTTKPRTPPTQPPTPAPIPIPTLSQISTPTPDTASSSSSLQSPPSPTAPAARLSTQTAPPPTSGCAAASHSLRSLSLLFPLLLFLASL